MSYFQTLAVLFIFSAFSAGLLFYVRGAGEIRRNTAFVLGVAWTVLASLEFWFLGPYSYIAFSSELEYGTPVLQYLARFHDGGLYSQNLAGGVDLAANFVHTGQIVSLEKILFQLLPPWAAAIVHNLSVFGVGTAGMYLLARRGAGAGRVPALALAALATLAHEYVTVATWHHGLGYALIPLGIYLVCARIGRRGYWAGVSAFAVVHAISCSVPHSVMSLFPGLVLGGLMIAPRRLPTLAGAMVIVLVPLIANWLDPVLAKTLYTPLSYRGSMVALHAENLRVLFTEVSVNLLTPYSLTSLAAVLLLWSERNRALWRITAILLSTLFGGLLLQEIPWKAIGLAPLAGLQFNNIRLALPPLSLLALAIGFATLPSGKRRLHRACTAALVGAAFGGLIWHKANNLSNWLSYGGLATLDRIPNLSHPSWRPQEPQRVVTIPYRLPVQVPLAYGLDTIDGNFNLVSRRLTMFWEKAVMKHHQNLVTGFISVENDEFDMKCCARYDISEQVDVDMLRLVNVGHVLSYLPLEGGGLVRVDGPEDAASVPPRRSTPIVERLTGYADWNLHPRKVHVYALPDPLPRAYAARSAIHLPAGTSDDDLIAAVRRNALSGAAIVLDGEAASDLPVDPGLRVTALRRGRDRLEIDVDAPGGGLLIVNMPHTPFWAAAVDGAAMRPFPVNLIQMGLVVPAGARTIAFTYNRPRVGG